jgi:hypothetical protein
MAVVVTIEFGASVEEYDAVNEKLDPRSNPPAGLIIHTGSVTDSGIRVVDVWESEQQFMDFREQRLGPAVGEVMGENAGPPNVQVLEVHDLVKP